MSRNSCVLANAKVNYYNTLWKCILALVICSICFSPTIVFSATGGGGSARGGGAGRSVSTNRQTVSTIPGHLMALSDGTIVVKENLDSTIKTIAMPLDILNPTWTASKNSIYSINTDFPSEYWLTFYNWSGSKWTNLGTTPKFTGIQNTELPGNTTVVVLETYTFQTGRYSFAGRISEDTPMPTLTKEAMIFSKYENEWQVGLSMNTETGKTVSSLDSYFPEQAYNLGSLHFYKSLQGSSFTAKMIGEGSLLTYVHYYDNEFNYLSTVNSYVNSTTGFQFVNDVNNSRYIKISFQNSSSTNSVGWYNRFELIGLNDDIVSGSYAIDNSSVSNIVNNVYASTKIYNIASGDSSPIVIVDGDGNTITLPGPTPINYEPGDPVPIPGDDDDDGSSGGIFDGIGDLLSGLLDLIMIPINLIIDTISQLVSTVAGVVESTLGLGEYMSALFSWMPQPLPALIVSVTSGMLLIALIKFLRG